LERQTILERERRWARPAAVAAIVAAPRYLLSITFDRGSDVPPSALETDRYREIDAAGGEVFAAAGVRAIAYLCLAAALLYLFRATQARSDRVSGVMVGFAFIGPVLLAVQGLVAVVARRGIASDFVAQAGAGGDVYTLLRDLIDDSTAHSMALSMLFPAILGMLIAMVYISLQAMRVGLLTRFLGTLGMALGASLILVPFGMALLLIALWFLWLGLLFLDRTPGPRPPAWAAGVAIPWPRPGEGPAEPEEEATDDGLFGGAEAEASGNGAGDHSGRRERARRRKRKRRR